MAIKVPPIGTVTTLWQTRAVAAVNEYKVNVGTAGQTWQTAVDNAEDEWSMGVNQAVSTHAYPRGTQGKAALYTDKAVNIGGVRYGPGIQAATNAYSTGMGKVLNVIANVTLPPRMAAGSNMARSAAVADALHQAKLAGQV